MLDASHAANEKHAWLNSAVKTDDVLADGKVKAIGMHALTAYASLLTSLDVAVAACGKESLFGSFSVKLSGEMATLQNEVLNRLCALATAAFKGSLAGKVDLVRFKGGLDATSYRAGLASDATMAVTQALAVAELHGKGSLDDFGAMVTAAWQAYDQLIAANGADGAPAADVDGELAAELAALREATATYVEWTFTHVLTKPRLARNAVNLMRFAAPLNRMVETRSLAELIHPSIRWGLERSVKQEKVL
jgi:hypothetical protein